eukprot:TRINITY_DN3086_c0_g1_i1.p1 TRINITY_DN3086_c0_g1~~TRINITY_DN3086_c0_g1_i1.p1  ORF type:complete len:285 (+),score=80.98 TRINITY_DN3086_c0_g1_i1:29-856(+)
MRTGLSNEQFVVLVVVVLLFNFSAHFYFRSSPTNDPTSSSPPSSSGSRKQNIRKEGEPLQRILIFTSKGAGGSQLAYTLNSLDQLRSPDEYNKKVELFAADATCEELSAVLTSSAYVSVIYDTDFDQHQSCVKNIFEKMKSEIVEKRPTVILLERRCKLQQFLSATASLRGNNFTVDLPKFTKFKKQKMEGYLKFLEFVGRYPFRLLHLDFSFFPNLPLFLTQNKLPYEVHQKPSQNIFAHENGIADLTFPFFIPNYAQLPDEDLFACTPEIVSV